MNSLAADVRATLDAATGVPNGPAGLVFGAIDCKGKVLVAEISGKKSLATG